MSKADDGVSFKREDQIRRRTSCSKEPFHIVVPPPREFMFYERDEDCIIVVPCWTHYYTVGKLMPGLVELASERWVG
jgi:hypothetical protein